VRAAEGSSEDQDIFRSCYGLVFFGVPNGGLEITSLMTMVRGQPNENLVRDLRLESPFLSFLHQIFRDKFHADSPIISFYETHHTPAVEVHSHTNFLTMMTDWRIVVF
jgi:hypothetical protein